MYHRILDCCDRLRADFENKCIRNELQSIIDEITYEQICNEELFVLVCSALILLISEDNINKNICDMLRQVMPLITDPSNNYVFIITYIRYLRYTKSLSNVEIIFIFEYINKILTKYSDVNYLMMHIHYILIVLLNNDSVMNDVKDLIEYNSLIVDIIRDIIPKLDILYHLNNKLKLLIHEQTDYDIYDTNLDEELFGSE